jgi:hypothetical protein
MPPEKEPPAVRRAREDGIDIDLIRALLELTPEERVNLMEDEIRALRTARPVRAEDGGEGRDPTPDGAT